MKKTRSVLCSERLPAEAIKILETRFERVFPLPPDRKLADPVCHHPDMILSVVGKVLICDADYFGENYAFMTELCDALGLAPLLSKAPRGNKYPADVGFNALLTEKYIFANLKYIAPELLKAAKSLGFEEINVNQGYTACSTLFSENTVVTADPTVAEAAKGKYDVIKVEGGGINLPPYDTGFIGGATAYFDKTLYTFGNLSDFNGFDTISKFLEEKNITLCPLISGKLCDFGGLKFV